MIPYTTDEPRTPYGAGFISYDPNDVHVEIEEIADAELETAHPTFRAWLFEEAEQVTVAAFIGCAAKSLFRPIDTERRGLALNALDTLRHDYRQWRIEYAKTTGEWDQIALRVAP